MDKQTETTQKMLDAVDAHVRQNGVAAIKVDDGEMFFFTVNTLEKLLARAKESTDQRAVVFIPFNRS